MVRSRTQKFDNRKNKCQKVWKSNRSKKSKLHWFILRVKIRRSARDKEENFFTERFNNCSGSSRQVYRFLNDIKAIWSWKELTCQKLARMKDCVKIEGSAVANELNDNSVKIGQTLQDPLKSYNFVTFKISDHQSVFLYPKNVEKLQKKQRATWEQTSMGV